MNSTPRVTVITVVYNAEVLIERTMQSVMSQSWPHVSQVVVDGKSSDGTLNVIRKFARPSLVIISEKDAGIYDAMNKGLQHAEGEYVIFMNAGDTFYSDKVLEEVFSGTTRADFYYGNTAVVDLNGNIVADRRHTPPNLLTWRSLQYGMCVSHQSMIVKRTICVDYDLKYRISADIDWTIRILKKADKIVNTRIYIAKFLEGGLSSSKRKLGWKERFSIFTVHYGILRNFLNHIWIVFRYLLHRLIGKSMT